MKTDQVQTLNYCAHAIEDLRATMSALTRVPPHSAAMLHRLIQMLKSSVKLIPTSRCPRRSVVPVESAS